MRKLHQEDLVPTLQIDAVLDPNAITLQLCKAMSQLAPYGQGNPEPLFLLENICIDTQRTIGKEGEHIQGYINGIKTVGFHMSNVLKNTNKQLDVVCRIGIDTWQGREEPQLFIEDAMATALVRM